MRCSLPGHRATWRSAEHESGRANKMYGTNIPDWKDNKGKAPEQEFACPFLRNMKEATDPYSSQLSFMCRWTNCKAQWSSCMLLWMKVPNVSRRCQYSSVSVCLQGTRACTILYTIALQIQTALQSIWSQRIRPIWDDFFFSPHNNYCAVCTQSWWEISRCEFHRNTVDWKLNPHKPGCFIKSKFLNTHWHFPLHSSRVH